MKYLLVVVACLVQPTTMLAQKSTKEHFYYLDSKMQGVAKIDSAKFLLRVGKITDTLWQFDTYRAFGPLISSEQYRDEAGTIPAGVFIFYHPTGYVDSIGEVANGRLIGDWNFCNDTGKVIRQKTYQAGRLIKARDFLQEEKERKDTAQSTTFKRVEFESEYVGGLAAWARYLNKNLRYPERALNNEITGKIVVEFVITTEGKATNIRIFKSIEYSLDKEAMRMIYESPKWKPATQDGRLVKSYKRQPIIFALQ